MNHTFVAVLPFFPMSWHLFLQVLDVVECMLALKRTSCFVLITTHLTGNSSPENFRWLALVGTFAPLFVAPPGVNDKN